MISVLVGLLYLGVPDSIVGKILLLVFGLSGFIMLTVLAIETITEDL